MYSFFLKGNKKNELFTEFSPRQISKMYCFDAFDRDKNRIIIRSKDVRYASFEFVATIQKPLF